MEKDAYKLHLEVQASHWWFRARESIIIHCLTPYIKTVKGGSFLDIGCGGGSFLNYLKSYGRISAMDPEETVVHYVQNNFGRETALRGSLPDNIPSFNQRFQLISALDVLEHIEDDHKSLEAIYELLAPGGLLILTVPAMMSLWSYHDVVSHHKHRYGRAELKCKLIQAGFSIEKLTYFNTFLYPPILLFRLLRKHFPLCRYNIKNDMSLGTGLLGKLLGTIFTAEKVFLKRGSFPVGVSLLAICRKTS